MSCFQVSDNCIQHILSLAAGYTVPEVHSNHQPGACEQLDALGTRLVALNEQAMRIRYTSPHVVETIEVAAVVDWKMRRVPLLAAIKAADCWLYQCAEGSEITDSIIYQQIKDLRDMACREYVSAQAEYKDANTWD